MRGVKTVDNRGKIPLGGGRIVAEEGRLEVEETGWEVQGSKR
jgi:hypothetical protein